MLTAGTIGEQVNFTGVTSIDHWFEKALAHHPEDRFSSAREMADTLYDAVRALPRARAAETNDDASTADAAPASTTTPTMFEVGLPRRRQRGVRKRAIAMLALAAAAASMLVWRSSGPEVQEANASPSEVPDATTDGPPLAPATPP